MRYFGPDGDCLPRVEPYDSWECPDQLLWASRFEGGSQLPGIKHIQLEISALAQLAWIFNTRPEAEEDDMDDGGYWYDYAMLPLRDLLQPAISCRLTVDCSPIPTPSLVQQSWFQQPWPARAVSGALEFIHRTGCQSIIASGPAMIMPALSMAYRGADLDGVTITADRPSIGDAQSFLVSVLELLSKFAEMVDVRRLQDRTSHLRLCIVNPKPTIHLFASDGSLDLNRTVGPSVPVLATLSDNTIKKLRKKLDLVVGTACRHRISDLERWGCREHLSWDDMKQDVWDHVDIDFKVLEEVSGQCDAGTHSVLEHESFLGYGQLDDMWMWTEEERWNA